MNIDEANSAMYACRLAGDYSGGVLIYKTRVHGAFTLDIIKNHSYLVPNLLHCLRKNSQINQAINFLQDHLHIQSLVGLSDSWLYEIGWLLYHKMKNFEVWAADKSGQRLKDYLAGLLSRDEIINNKLLLIRLTAEAFRLSIHHKYDAVWLSNILDNVKMEDLNDQPQSIQVERNRNPVVNASHREVYIVLLSKLKYKAGAYQECLDICSMAFKLIPRFHHGNHVWLARRTAMCLRELGNLPLAIEAMEKIIVKKPDWFLLAELGHLYGESGRLTDALNCLVRAVVQQGHSEYKAKLYGDLVFLLKSSPEYMEKTPEHLHLAIATRKEKLWKIPGSLNALKSNFDLQINAEPSAKIYNKLLPFWENLIDQTMINETTKDELVIGSVTRILNEGENGDGFITSKSGGSIYFRMRKVKRGHILKLNETVLCSVIERDYRGRKVLNAEWVQLQ